MYNGEMIDIFGVGRWTYEAEPRLFEFIGEDGSYQLIRHTELSKASTLSMETWSNGSNFGLAILIYGTSVYRLESSGDIEAIATIDRSNDDVLQLSHESYIEFESCIVLAYDFGAIAISRTTGEVIWHFKHNQVIYPIIPDPSSDRIRFHEHQLLKDSQEFEVSLDSGKRIEFS